jgi:hypothetical protein
VSEYDPEEVVLLIQHQKVISKGSEWREKYEELTKKRVGDIVGVVLEKERMEWARERMEWAREREILEKERDNFKGQLNQLLTETTRIQKENGELCRVIKQTRKDVSVEDVLVLRRIRDCLGGKLWDLFEQLDEWSVSQNLCNRKMSKLKTAFCLVIFEGEKVLKQDVVWRLMMKTRQKIVEKISTWNNLIWKGIKNKLNDVIKEQEKSGVWAKETWLMSVYGNFTRRQMRIVRKMMGKTFHGHKDGKQIWSTIGNTGVFVLRMATERQWMDARAVSMDKHGFGGETSVFSIGKKAQMRPMVENIKMRLNFFLSLPHLRDKWVWIEKDGVKHVFLAIFGDGAPQSKQNTMTNIGLRFINFCSESPRLLLWLFGGDVAESDEDVVLFFTEFDKCVTILEKEDHTIGEDTFRYHFIPVGDMKMLYWLAGLSFFLF